MRQIEHTDKIILEPEGTCQITILWLHGLGADGYDFVPLAQQLQLSHRVRYIFPHAPYRPITLNHGMVMRGWYDIYQIKIGAKEDQAGLKQSCESLFKLIEDIQPSSVILGGFSQGGALALYTGLMHDKVIGIFGLSCYLPLSEHILSQPKTKSSTPIFLAHGLNDTVVPFVFGQLSANSLKTYYTHVQYHSYSMAHEVSLEEINDLTIWLNDTISKSHGSQ